MFAGKIIEAQAFIRGISSPVIPINKMYLKNPRVNPAKCSFF